MGENLTPTPETERYLINIASRVGQSAVSQIDARYGKGYPDHSSGIECTLPYHNGQHARAVGRDALKLCVALGVSPVGCAVAEAAGKTHDMFQLHDIGVNERLSAEWFEQEMYRLGFFKKDLVMMGKSAIDGTEPRLNDRGVVIGQKATEIEYLSKEAELVVKSTACADMGEVYTPLGPYLAHQLFRELESEDLTDFQRKQVETQESYKYPLSQAESMLATHKNQVIAYTHRVLKQLESGEMETWEQLISQDLQFKSQLQM